MGRQKRPQTNIENNTRPRVGGKKDRRQTKKKTRSSPPRPSPPPLPIHKRGEMGTRRGVGEKKAALRCVDWSKVEVKATHWEFLGVLSFIPQKSSNTMVQYKSRPKHWPFVQCRPRQRHTKCCVGFDIPSISQESLPLFFITIQIMRLLSCKWSRAENKYKVKEGWRYFWLDKIRYKLII